MSNLKTLRLMVVIGAQKSGTATLSVDLSRCKHFELDLVKKEESPLLAFGTSAARDASLLDSLSPEKQQNVYVDVSTLYAVEGTTVPVGKVTASIPHIKIAYILREPLSRALSHYRQECLTGKEKLTAAEAITPDSDYVCNSLYGQQLKKWADFVPAENIKIVKFEEYINNRVDTIRELCDFAEIPDEGCEAIERDIAHNVTAARPRFHPWIHRILSTNTYHRLVRKNLDPNTRDRLKRVISLRNNSASATVEPQLERELRAIFDQDNEVLRSIIPDAPCWTSS